MVIESGMEVSGCSKCGNIWNGSLHSVNLCVEIIVGLGPLGGVFVEGFVFFFLHLSMNLKVWL